jgi:hypothetical protein
MRARDFITGLGGAANWLVAAAAPNAIATILVALAAERVGTKRCSQRV